MRWKGALFTMSVLACLSLAAQTELTPLGCGEETKLRAIADETPAAIRFVNATQDRFDVFRLDAGGRRFFEFSLDPSASVRKDTFLTHPWVVADLSGNCRAVYLPTTEEAIARIAALSINLPRTGIIFDAVAGGPPPPPQRFSIINGGTGVMNWAVSFPMMSGYMIRGWARLSPPSGTSDAAKAPATVEVKADPYGLDPGEYCNLVEVMAPGAINSPQNFCVVMLVHPEGTDLGPQVEPAGLLFAGAPGGGNPEAQTVKVTNLSNLPMPLSVEAVFDGGVQWFSYELKSETVGSGETAAMTIRPDFSLLAAGSYVADLTMRFSADGPAARVRLQAVAPPSPPKALAGASRKASAAAEACVPTKLLPVFTLLGPDFRCQAGWPIPLEVLVADDCGQPMTTGSVVATFSNNDPPLHLTPLPGARWSGTWPPRNVVPTGMTITVEARQPEKGLFGLGQIVGGVQEASDVPFVPPGGIVSAASRVSSAVGPGSYVAILGDRLSEGSEAATQFPLRTRMQGTEVFLSGRTIPLVSTSKEQVKALVPYSVAVNGRHQMIVRRGHCMSVPMPVEAAAAQPAVFTADDSGRGQGRIYVLDGEGKETLAGLERPAAAGETIVIYAAGLGLVDPPVDAGAELSSSTPVRTVNPVTVLIGGKEAAVSFSGLVPESPGAYRVIAIVPEGIEPGPEVAVTLATGGQTSPPVTMAVK